MARLGLVERAADTGRSVWGRLAGLPATIRWLAVAGGAVIAWRIADAIIDRGLPLGIVVVGLVFGSLYALVAIGLVLIYRANRVVNFAQAELGAVAAVVAIQLVREFKWNYFLAVASGLLMATVLGGLIDVGIIRRFRTAPRLILAVATIGVAQILSGASILIALAFSGGTSAGGFQTPFKASFTLFPAVIRGDHILAMITVPMVLLGLVIFFRRSPYGIAIRASADNTDRANLLGVPTGRLSTMVWALAGLLSAIAIILRIPIVGFLSFTSVTGSGNSLLLRTLAAAVIGRMENLPVTAAAALALGVIETTSLWVWGHGTYTDVFLVVLILVALLLQKGKFSRSEEAGLATGAWRAIREVRPIPSELRRLPEVRIGQSVARVAVLAIALVAPLIAGPGQRQLLTLICIYSLVAVSLVVLTGWAGQISLGQFALVGFGGATTALLYGKYDWDLFLAIPAGVIVAALVALLIGLPALRIRGPFLAVTTLAFAVVSASYFLTRVHFRPLIAEFIDRPVLWGKIGLESELQMYYLSLVVLGLVIFGVRRLRNSRTGRALIAIRDNETAAQSVAVNTTKLKLTAFVIAGAISGLAGALYVLEQTGLKPGSYESSVSLRLFSMVVIGGLGSIPGAIMGAVYIRGAEILLPSAWQFIVSGAGILLLLLIVPGGVGEVIYRTRDGVLRRVAKRRNIIVPSLVADVRVVEDAPVPLGAALRGMSVGGNGHLRPTDQALSRRN